MPRKRIFHDDPFMKSGALICDNPECDHTDPEQQFSQDLVNKPCPKCGSNMLTQEDFDTHMRTIKTLLFIDKWLGWLLGTHPEDTENLQKVRLHTINGKTNITCEEE